jgi:hypothetical protein
MFVRRICAALFSASLAFGGVVLAATPSHAEGNSCSAATPFAGNTASTVGPGDYQDYWSYSAFVGTYKATLTRTAGLARMIVWNHDCSATYCSSTTSSCTFTLTAPATVVVEVYNNSTTTSDAYTVAMEWTTQPKIGTACADGVDNDGDGFADSADSGCSGPLDFSEEGTQACPLVAGVETCLSLTPGTEIARVPVALPGVTVTAVVGTIDRYDFPTAAGTVSIPCVVVGDVNPCAALGGTFAARIATLGPVNVPTVDPVLQPVATVGICLGSLTATVNGIGVSNFAAATLC